MSNFLIIDDSKFMREVESRLLEKLGHTVLAAAENGQEAIDIYLENWVDIEVVLLDVVLPKMNGLKVLIEILGINPFAKVIMVSSISNLAIVQGCLNRGAKTYVVKPFRLSEFVKTIGDVLEDD
jgi:CheY-like chemotaxis protein